MYPAVISRWAATFLGRFQFIITTSIIFIIIACCFAGFCKMDEQNAC
jgi:hypothetical protein